MRTPRHISFPDHSTAVLIALLPFITVLISLFLSLLLPLAHVSRTAFPGFEPWCTASAEQDTTGPPIIHSVLVDGKDSGNLHPLPYQTVNVSALVTGGEEANVTLMRGLPGSGEVLPPWAMHRDGDRFWYEVMIPGDLSDLETYEFLVRCSNPNGSDSLRGGRVITFLVR